MVLKNQIEYYRYPLRKTKYQPDTDILNRSFANFADMKRISKVTVPLKEQRLVEEKVLNYIKMVGGKIVAVSLINPTVTPGCEI